MKINKIPAIIIAIVTLALISIYAVPSSVYSNSPVVYKANFSDDKSYSCPMHPEITSDKPGSCSICSMDLVKKDDSKSNCCVDPEKCKQMGCDIEKCKAGTGGCSNECMDKCKAKTGGCSNECMDKCKKETGDNSKDCMGKCPMMKDMKMDDSKCKSKCEHK